MLTQKKIVKNCKICSSLPENVLEQFNYDIILQTNPLQEILDQYNQFLPDGKSSFKWENVSNHRNHIEAEFIRSTRSPSPVETLLQKDEIDELELIVPVDDEPDKSRILSFLYSDRLKMIFHLREKLAVCMDAYQLTPTVVLDEKISAYIRMLNGMESGLSKDILAHIKEDRDTKEAQINQILASRTQDFLRLVGLELLGPFAADPQKIKLILNVVSINMEKLFGDSLGITDGSKPQ